MEKITEQLSGVTDSMERMEVSRDITHKSIEKISEVSQDTASMIEEVSATTQQQVSSAESLSQYAERLNNMAIELNSSISKFTIS